MKNKSILIVFLLSFILYPVFPQSWDEFLTACKENDPDFLAITLAQKEARMQADTSQKIYSPLFTIDGGVASIFLPNKSTWNGFDLVHEYYDLTLKGYTKLSFNVPLNGPISLYGVADLPVSFINPATETIAEWDFNGYYSVSPAFSVGLNIPLFIGDFAVNYSNSTIIKAASENQLLDSLTNIQKVSNQYILNIYARFLYLDILQIDWTIKDNSLKMKKSVYAQNSVLFSQNRIGELDLKMSEISVLEAELSLQKSRNSLDTVINELKHRSGLQTIYEGSIDSIKSLPPLDIEKIIADYVTNNITLVALARKIQLESDQIYLLAKNEAPEINLDFSYSPFIDGDFARSNNLQFMDALTADFGPDSNQLFSGRLSFSFPLGSIGSVLDRIKQKKLRLEKLKTEYAGFESKIQMEAETKKQELISLQKQLELSTKIAKNYEGLTLALEEMFSQGRLTSNEYESKKLEILQRQSELIKQHNDFMLLYLSILNETPIDISEIICVLEGGSSD